MKKLIVFCLMLFVAIVVPIVLIAQDVEPVDVTGLAIDAYFVTLAAFAAIIVPITALLNRVFKINEGFVKQFLSWGVSLILAFIANIIGLGIFDGLVWYEVTLYAFGGALIANGIFDINVIKLILGAIGLNKPKPIAYKR